MKWTLNVENIFMNDRICIMHFWTTPTTTAAAAKKCGINLIRWALLLRRAGEREGEREGKKFWKVSLPIRMPMDENKMLNTDKTKQRDDRKNQNKKKKKIKWRQRDELQKVCNIFTIHRNDPILIAVCCYNKQADTIYTSNVKRCRSKTATEKKM